jgi:hypothetical protein
MGNSLQVQWFQHPAASPLGPQIVVYPPTKFGAQVGFQVSIQLRSKVMKQVNELYPGFLLEVIAVNYTTSLS